MEKKIVVTLGRQYGSGAREIGQMLAKRLEINFYDKEILKLVSDTSGIEESYFHLADERPGQKLLYKVAKSQAPRLEKPTISGRLLADDNLFLFQSEVIRGLAEAESCVIVGRCADYLLKDMENIVSIYVHAPEDTRIARIMERYEMTWQEAEKAVNRVDKERSDYYSYYTGRSWGDLNHYDLTFDSSRMNPEGAVELIVQYLKVRTI